jgi:hypothetical protein
MGRCLGAPRIIRCGGAIASTPEAPSNEFASLEELPTAIAAQS